MISRALEMDGRTSASSCAVAGKNRRSLPCALSTETRQDLAQSLLNFSVQEEISRRCTNLLKERVSGSDSPFAMGGSGMPKISKDR